MFEFNGIDITPFLANLAADSKNGNGRKISSSSHSTSVVEGVPFLIAAGGPEGKGRHPKSVEHPLRTVLTENHEALIRPFLVVVNHGDTKPAAENGAEENSSANSPRCYSVEKPIPTVTCKNGYGLVNAFLTKYYGTSVKAQSVDDPLDAVTTRDRFALVEPAIVAGRTAKEKQGEFSVPLIPLGDDLYLDIRFRMLQWHELAGAQGFPKEYIFTGNKSTKVKQIGNAVPRYAAKALCKERLKNYVPRLPAEPATLMIEAVC
jgi:DNA (cytosine-5)-methyltransferase 1